VPPPPVAGAAVRNGLAAGLCVADGDADGLGVGDSLAEGLTLVPGVVAPAVPLGGIVIVAELVTAGENGVGVAEGEDVVQAETNAEKSMVRAALPTTVNLALSPLPMMAVRIFMGLLMRRVGGGPVSRSRHRKKSRPARSLPAPAEGRSLEAPTAIRVKPTDSTNTQWPVHH
jgi:hypothetical protein